MLNWSLTPTLYGDMEPYPPRYRLLLGKIPGCASDLHTKDKQAGQREMKTFAGKVGQRQEGTCVDLGPLTHPQHPHFPSTYIPASPKNSRHSSQKIQQSPPKGGGLKKGQCSSRSKKTQSDPNLGQYNSLGMLGASEGPVRDRAVGQFCLGPTPL